VKKFEDESEDEDDGGARRIGEKRKRVLKAPPNIERRTLNVERLQLRWLVSAFPPAI
jgi:hypothetical protein